MRSRQEKATPKQAISPQRTSWRTGNSTRMSAIIDTIFSVGEKLFGLRGALAQARQARKQQVAEFLASIAQTVETTSAMLKQGNYPHGTCQELLSHSEHMVAAIGDLVGDPKATDLANQLK